MKRNFYIVSFAILGILLQFLAHALIETWYIGLLLADFSRYGFGLTWENWVLIHNILTVLFFLAGAWIGYKEGVYWWKKIYEENRITIWRAEWKEKCKKIPVSWLIATGTVLIIFSGGWILLEELGIIARPGEQRVCPMDAMQCPDGSYVGRTGPNCEFASCPVGLKSDFNHQ